MKRFALLFLALLLFLSGCMPTEHPEKTVLHTELSFSDLPDETPNVSLEIARVKELLFRIERGELTGVKAKERLDRHWETYREIQTAAALAYVRYCMDITNEVRKAAYDALRLETETLYALLVEAERKLSEDPALADSYNEDTLRELDRADSLHDPSLAALRTQERALIGAYEAAMQGFTIEAQGRTWTKEQILSDPTLSYDSFKTLYEAFLIAYNREAGGIYLQLIDVRNRIAHDCGYPSYAEYAYALYDRDYTTTDTVALAEQMQKRLVPHFCRMQGPLFQAQMRLLCGTFYEPQTMRRVQDALIALLPELSEPWTYMTTHGMYDCSGYNGRMPGSFTTYFASYGAPFLFTTWDDSYEMVSTLLHEFGHFLSYYQNGESSSASLDLAEIDSQGLELLAFSAYDSLFGALADAARTMNLFTALYVLLDGCMEDAFQQYAYHTEGVTLEQLNEEYGRLCEAYGLKELGLDALAWTEVPHTFQSPMYYVSYSVGMVTAFELLDAEQTQSGAGIEAYRTILNRDEHATLRETIRRAKLLDPFDPETLDRIERVLIQNVAG